jgi:hypothetical protein
MPGFSPGIHVFFPARSEFRSRMVPSRGSLHHATASRLALCENNNCLMSVAGLAGLNR